MLINGLRFEVAILRHVRRRFFCDVGCAPPIIVVLVVVPRGGTPAEYRPHSEITEY